MKRAIIIVLDSVGIGELPDAAEYGDVGANTLINIKCAIPSMDLKNMNALGLSSINGGEKLADCPITDPQGSFCKLAEHSKGKDTTTGHWEMAGIWLEDPLPVFLNGFPKEMIAEFEKRIGRKTIGNYAASGTEILDELGEEHMATGYPIVYTSADSVFQVAMHEDIIPLEEQYRICQIARDMLVFPDNVSRVIARPFTGTAGNFIRTKNRHDFSLEPLGRTMLDSIKAAGLTVAGVGKISDIFTGRGVTESVHIVSNMDGVDKTLEYMDTVENGLIFSNLVDFDMIYGHRRNAEAYAEALVDFDKRVPEILEGLRKEDLLLITADHGCDPTHKGTDHTREYIPLLIYGQEFKKGLNLGVRSTYADIGKTVLDWLGLSDDAVHGTSFLGDII